MTHSTITLKGQTTLPVQIRRALHLQAGDKILYEIQGDAVLIRAHPGAKAVFGMLKPPAAKAGVPFEWARSESRAAWVEEASQEGS
jgi:AbrB family looped-hinge helix DNA binding protein